jgi:predicted DNA-binding transcriptional regulator AlpA
MEKFHESHLSLPIVAAYTDINVHTILAQAEAGSFPSPVDFNGDEVWLTADIANWLEDSPLSPPTFEWGEAA